MVHIQWDVLVFTNSFTQSLRKLTLLPDFFGITTDVLSILVVECYHFSTLS